MTNEIKRDTEMKMNDLPKHVLFYNIEIQKSVFQYIKQLNDQEYIAYIIAKEHLGTSFNIVKSNGYINWKSSQPLEKSTFEKG